MSYLSNILSSIGDDAPTRAPAPAARPAPPAPLKRKADDELTSGPAKRPTTPVAAQNGNIKRPATPNNAPNGSALKSKPAVQNGAEKYPGAARAGPASLAKQNGTKPQASAASSLSVKTTSKPAAAPAKPTTPITDKPAPKKGSYADIIARAKANQEAKQPVGVIMHKQGEKVDRSALKKEAAKDKNGLLKDKKAGDRSRTGSAEVSSRKGDKAKQKPKPVEKSDYKGSAKPTTPIYTGSARPGQGKKAPPKRYDGYAGTDEEIDDYDEEEDYYSDESDMEAGAFDVEQEEQAALRQAKRDDAMELALENRLRAEKDAKKARLQELAAARAKSRSSGY